MSSGILISGNTCSGKTTLARVIAERTLFPVNSFGGVIRKYSLACGFSTERRALQDLGQKLLAAYGSDGFVDWIREQSPDFNWEGPFILEGLRSVSVYNSLRVRLDAHILIFCHCNSDEQLVRLMRRDGVSVEIGLDILSHELEKNVSELSALAHFVQKEGDPVDDIFVKINQFLKIII